MERRTDGWSQDVACVHDVISPCTVRHFGRGREKKKSRTISVVLTDLGASLTLILDASRFSEQAALFDQVPGSRVQPQLLHEAMAGKALFEGRTGSHLTWLHRGGWPECAS